MVFLRVFPGIPIPKHASLSNFMYSLGWSYNLMTPVKLTIFAPGKEKCWKLGKLLGPFGASFLH